MTWDLTPVYGGTQVNITAANVPDAVLVEDHAAGMASSLANLAAYVDCNFLRKIAFGYSSGYLGNITHLTGKVIS